MKTALDQVEEAVSLLRQQTARTWVFYLLGAVPFSLAMLAFVRDMTSVYGANLCLPDALLCSAAFLWSSFWKARFAGSLLVTMGGSELTARHRNSVWQCAFIQIVIQSGKLLILPFAAISIVPMPWISALFRAVNTEAGQSGATLRGTLQRAAERAAIAPKKNWIALLICTIIGLVVFINVFVIMLILPRLLQSFTGAESDWTRYSRPVGNGYIFAVAVAGTWLIMDPLLQAYSVVRSFYFESRQDARDLRLWLQRIATVAVLLLAIMRPAFPSQRPANSNQLSAEDVRRGVHNVIEDRDYNWLRRDKAPSPDDWFGARLFRDWNHAMDVIGSWFHNAWRALGRLLDRLFGRQNSNEDPFKGKAPSAPQLKGVLYAAGALLIVITVVFLFRRRRRTPFTATLQSSSSPVAARNVEEALATERPHEEWLALARELAGRGELRLAVRAMYLANLSYLGSQELLGITKFKSNAIYERELRLRCRTDAVCTAFVRSNRDYERVWYGQHAVTSELQERFEQEVSNIRSYA